MDPPSPGTRRGAQPVLPPTVERLLRDVVADGFVLYCCGGLAEPTALVASYEWEHYVDLVTIRNFDRITAARVPKRGPVDVFAPETVVWAYEGAPQWTLRALLNLVHPRHHAAPRTSAPAPRSLHIPRPERRPLTIRPPAPGRAGVRAVRLAAAMTASDDAVLAVVPRQADAQCHGPAERTALRRSWSSA
jgi:hypothetical protein